MSVLHKAFVSDGEAIRIPLDSAPLYVKVQSREPQELLGEWFATIDEAMSMSSASPGVIVSAGRTSIKIEGSAILPKGRTIDVIILEE